MTKMNIGVFSEIINKKADLDLRNVDVSKTDIVIEYQEPTAENNYTWYRLYASGWVEQGGVCSGTANWYTIIFPIPFIDSHYTLSGSAVDSNNNFTVQIIGTYNKTKTSVDIVNAEAWGGTGTAYAQELSWQVSGKADMTGHEILPSKKEKDENDHRVIAFQKPTADNNYTWYRKYADGWVEQGGSNSTMNVVINFPVTMADTNYYASVGFVISNVGAQNVNKYVDRMQTWSSVQNSCTYGGWYVCGLYATE